MKLIDYSTIFWDFDGVIKDSMPAKAAAFYEVFISYGEEVASQALAHHERHGGVSRLVKIPLYFKTYVGREAGPKELERAMQRFADLSWEATINSPYVPGAYEYLQKHHLTQDFYIVTGTPEGEILESCQRLGIYDWFQGIYGAPKSKTEIIQAVMEERGLKKSDCLMIGDARADQVGAEANGIDFLLREMSENQELFKDYPGPRVKDFCWV